MRLGNTMREAILSTMTSSDMELDARGRDFITNITKKKGRCFPGETNLKPGPSKTLVAPVQLISNFWGGIKVTGTAADNEMMTKLITAYWAANEKIGDSSHQGCDADKRS